MVGIDEIWTSTLHLSMLMSENQRDWDKRILPFPLAYRSSVQESTGYICIFCMLIRVGEIKQPSDFLYGLKPTNDHQRTTKL